jgi:riboflavin biosynthesis pyrimidine reductase
MSARSANDRPRVLVLYERGGNGALAIDQALELVEAQDGQLTVVTLAARDARVRGTGVSARDYNDAVRESAKQDLEHARARLGSRAGQIVFGVVVEGGKTSLGSWAAEGAFDVILLPARRRLFSRRTHPLAAGLRGATGADVREVSA